MGTQEDPPIIFLYICFPLAARAGLKSDEPGSGPGGKKRNITIIQLLG